MNKEVHQSKGGPVMSVKEKKKSQKVDFQKNQKEAPFIGQHDDQENFFHLTFGC